MDRIDMRGYLVLILCLFLVLGNRAGFSQDSEQVNKLKVGDEAPKINAFKWIKGGAVNHFDKGRIYVIEFGATWCTPCAHAIPKLTAMQKKYGDRVTILGFFVMEFNSDSLNNPNPKYVAKVQQYVEKQGVKYGYTAAVDDPLKFMENSWVRAAGRNGIPVSFVVDGDGKIAWIGSNSEALDIFLESMVSGKYNLDTVVATERNASRTQVHYDDTKPLLVDGNGGSDRDFLFRSLITRYTGDIKSGSHEYVDSYWWAAKGSEYELYQGRVQEIGQSLVRLYYMAYGDTLWNYPHSMIPGTGVYVDTIKSPHQRRSYGKYWYRPILEVGDSSSFENDGISIDNRYNYSLVAPKDKSSALFLQTAMRRDLDTYFGYDVTVEDRLMPCWKLIASDKTKESLKTKTPGDKYRFYVDEKGDQVFKNAQVRDIIFQLEILYGCSGNALLKYRPDKQPPFIDETGITEKIDYVYDGRLLKEINDNRRTSNTFELYRSLLKKVGLDLVPGKKMMKVVVIRDRKL